MPDMNTQRLEGGPVSPVYLMNNTPGDPKGSGSVSVAAGTKAASGLNTLIAAPAAGYRIVVYAFVVQNESATATTMELQDAVTRWRVLGQNQGDGLAMAFDALQPWRLNEATALTLKLSGANSCGYSVQYAIERV